jgi:hypothetical protein
MAEANPLRIREPAADPSPSDAQFVIDAFDSTLAHLESIGSGAQWGSLPFSKKDGFCDRIHEWIDSSTDKGKPVRVFIAETTQAAETPSTGNLHFRLDEDGNKIYLLGAMVLADAWAPDYVVKVCGEQSGLEAVDGMLKAKEYIYLEVLVTDFRAGAGGLRKGTGAALLRKAVEYVGKAGRTTLLGDCWTGNERSLVRWVAKPSRPR